MDLFSGVTADGVARVLYGRPFAIRLVLKDAQGNVQSLVGRTFALSFRPTKSTAPIGSAVSATGGTGAAYLDLGIGGDATPAIVNVLRYAAGVCEVAEVINGVALPPVASWPTVAELAADLIDATASTADAPLTQVDITVPLGLVEVSQIGAPGDSAAVQVKRYLDATGQGNLMPDASDASIATWLGNIASTVLRAAAPILQARFLITTSIGDPPFEDLLGTWYPDGKTIAAVNGDRVLLISQSDPRDNGVWVFNGVGKPFTRPTDYAVGERMPANTTVMITDGAKYIGQIWQPVIQGKLDVGIDPVQWQRVDVLTITEPNAFLGGPRPSTNKAAPPVSRWLVAEDNTRLRAHPSASLIRDVNELLRAGGVPLSAFIDPTRPYDMGGAMQAAAKAHPIVVMDVPRVYLATSLSTSALKNTTWIVPAGIGQSAVKIVCLNPAANGLVAQSGMHFIGGTLGFSYRTPPAAGAGLSPLVIAASATGVKFPDLVFENCDTAIDLSAGSTHVRMGEARLGTGCFGRLLYAKGAIDLAIARAVGASTSTTQALIEIDSGCRKIEIEGGDDLLGGRYTYYQHNSGVGGVAPYDILIRALRGGNTALNGALIAAGDVDMDRPFFDTCGDAGISVTTSGEITLNRPRVMRAQKDGINLKGAGPTYALILDAKLYLNNQIAGSYGAIGIENGVGHVHILGGSTRDPSGAAVALGVVAAGAQTYGIDVRGSSHVDVLADGFDCSNVMMAAGWRDQTTAAGSGTIAKQTIIRPTCAIPGTAGPAYA